MPVTPVPEQAGDGSATAAAQAVGLQALAFVAGDQVLLERFLSLSGLDLAALRDRAESPELLAGVLDFLLANERDLFAFCEYSGLGPEAPARYRHLLADPPPT